MSKKKIRKLKGDEDLFDIFGCDDDINEDEDISKDVLLNKHGVPVLNNDIGKLKGKNHNTLLREKGLYKKTGKKQTVDKKIKNYPAPELDLDLHGFTAIEAELSADSFIRSALQKGCLTLRIIVGKGTHSEFGAVLPDAIEDLILKLKKEKVVLSYRWEKKIKRKSGAIIVYLP
ncbi:MAG: Smr/MutS family protein [Desulfobacterales bacterium]|nr:Smr/MutS family protein [Desulfobacterales bacterium]MCP4161062.1 Smr/MutS family protein [Deltaproteobacteria bacterium]